MNTGYVLAWLVIVVFGLGASALAFVAANAWRYSRPLRWPLAGLVLAWAVVPHRFDGEHIAPALVVAVFRWLFEDGADALTPATRAAATAVAVLAVALVVAVAHRIARGRPARRERPRAARQARRSTPRVIASQNKVQ